jgi:histidinol dehydrogenase
LFRVLSIAHGSIEAASLRKSKSVSDESFKRVNLIIDDVIKRGDKALIESTAKFDGVKLRRLRVTKDEINNAYKFVTKKQIDSLKIIKKRLTLNENKLLENLSNIVTNSNGIRLERVIKPLYSVGCYIPGGMARYPSTVIMCATPAKIAKVKRVVITCPPLKDGSIDPLTLVAADLCDVDEIYKVGGAQAVAALAYGTETISKVAKIVGPGGMYVNIAKIMVSKQVGIDMIAGPTELVVFADSTADPSIIAKDLIAQAEHSPDTICGLVTKSTYLVKKVSKYLEDFLSDNALPRKEIIRQSIRNNSFIGLCKNDNVAISFINEIAPEHLQIICRRAKSIINRISSAGVVLEGKYTPASASDFCLGSNHVLPTMQVAKYRGGLSVLDFVKIVSHVSANKQALESMKDPIKEVALMENLPNHFQAVEERFKS